MGFISDIFKPKNNKDYLLKIKGLIGKTDNFIDMSTPQGIEKGYKDCPTVSSIVGNCKRLSLNHKIYELGFDDELKNEISIQLSDQQLYEQIYEDLIKQLLLYKVVILINTVGGFSGRNNYEVLDFVKIDFDWKLKKGRRILEDLIKITYDDQDYSFEELTIIGNKKVLLTGEFEHNALSYPVSNLILDYQIKHEIINEKGAIGMLSPESSGKASTFDGVNLDPTAKSELEKELSKDYGVTKGKKKFYIANSPMKYTPLSMSIDQLKISEDKEENEKVICQHFNYPQTIFSDTTYDNQKVARASIYRNILIPFSMIITPFFEKVSGKKIIIDYSENDELQDAKLDLVERNSKVINYVSTAIGSGLMTVEEGRDELSKYI